MSKKNIHQLFELLTPKAEQKEKIFNKIVEKSHNEHKKLKKMNFVQRLRPAVLVAALMLCLTTTAFAVAYIGLDEQFSKFLNPVNNEQAEFLSNGAYVVDKQISNKDGILDIKQVIGDGNLTYILMDFIAPEGTVLNAARYRFEDAGFDTNQGYSLGFKVLDDGNSNDNRISLIMNIMTNNSIAGEKFRFIFKDLQAADQYPGVFETVLPGTWKTAITLDFKEYSNFYQVDQNITMYGYSAVLKSISVSPISITLKLESGSIKEISDATGNFKEIAPNEYLDDYPITINYKDGTSETTSIFTGMSSADFLAGEMITIKTFDNVINDKEIASIVFFDKEIPIIN